MGVPLAIVVHLAFFRQLYGDNRQTLGISITFASSRVRTAAVGVWWSPIAVVMGTSYDNSLRYSSVIVVNIR